MAQHINLAPPAPSDDEIAFSELLAQAHTFEDLEALESRDPRSHRIESAVTLGETILQNPNDGITVEATTDTVGQTTTQSTESETETAKKQHPVRYETIDGKQFAVIDLGKSTEGPRDKPFARRRTGKRGVNLTSGRMTHVSGYSQLTPKSE